MVRSLDYFSQDYLDDKRIISEFAGNSFYRVRSSDYYLGQLENIWFDSLSWKIEYVEVSGFKGLGDDSVLVRSSDIVQLRNYSNTLCIKLKASQIVTECIRIKAELTESNPGQKRAYIKAMIQKEHQPSNVNYDASYFASTPKTLFQGSSFKTKSMEVLTMQDLKEFSLKTQDGVEIDVCDVLVNFSKWNVAFLVVEVPYWFSTRKVICPVSFVNHVNLEKFEADINLKFDAIKEAPSFDFSFFTRAYEIMILDYFVNYIELDNTSGYIPLTNESSIRDIR